jgi:hypothetical protein
MRVGPHDRVAIALKVKRVPSQPGSYREGRVGPQPERREPLAFGVEVMKREGPQSRNPHSAPLPVSVRRPAAEAQVEIGEQPVLELGDERCTRPSRDRV